MQVNITGQHMEITPALHDYVEKKMEKIRRHFDHITHVHVILSVDKKFLQKAEAKMDVSKAELYAEAITDNLYTSIDEMVHKLDRQVIKHKEKMKNHHEGDEH